MAGALHDIGTATAALGTPFPAGIAQLLAEMVGHDAAGVRLESERLGRGVFRVRILASSEATSVVVKRVEPLVAERNRLVARRWLPWLGLDDAAPRVLGAIAAPGAESVWQVQEDVGGSTLHEHCSAQDRVAAAVERIAELHTRAGGHPLTAECRRAGQDLGMRYFTTNVGDAARLLDALRPPRLQPSRAQAELRDRLTRRLERLLGDGPRRARLEAEAAGPETMLHGDLWTTNILVEPSEGHRVRLVDWDRVGAGRFCYDLSILLYRFAARDRAWIVDRYREAVARHARWRLPAAPELNLLFDTFERARYANRIVWAALELLRDGSARAWDELADIERWFRALKPVIQGARARRCDA